MRSARKFNDSEIGWLVFRAEQVEEARKARRQSTQWALAFCSNESQTFSFPEPLPCTRG